MKIARHTYCDINTKIGDHTRINRKSYLTDATIGKYCAIAGPLTIRSSNHDKNLLAFQSHLMKNIIGSELKNYGIKRSGVKIGDNCWIGDSVIMLDGASIGHSSIVAAGAVVNKKFPSFSVIGGCPAKLISRRFDGEKILLLDNINWWEWDANKLKNNRDLFEVDLEKISTEGLKSILQNIKE